MCLKTNLWKLIERVEYKRHVKLKEKNPPKNKHGACPVVSMGVQACLRLPAVEDVHTAS